jgi:hypothetical protein
MPNKAANDLCHRPSVLARTRAPESAISPYTGVHTSPNAAAGGCQTGLRKEVYQELFGLVPATAATATTAAEIRAERVTTFLDAMIVTMPQWLRPLRARSALALVATGRMDRGSPRFRVSIDQASTRLCSNHRPGGEVVDEVLGVPLRTGGGIIRHGHIEWAALGALRPCPAGAKGSS